MTKTYLESERDILMAVWDGSTKLNTGVPSNRNAGVLHRSAITAVDKLTNFTAGNMTGVDVATGGALVHATAYFYSVVPGNRWGPTKSEAAIDTLTTADDSNDTHMVDMTIAQGVGQGSTVAEWYDIFLSTDAAPLYVGRITEAQRAAGGFDILTMGTITANAGVGAGHLFVGVVGTGIATGATAFTINNAYTPSNTAITAVSCVGYKHAHVLVKLALTDLRAAPALSIIPFLSNQVSATDFHQGSVQALSLLGAVGQGLEQDYTLDVDGSTGLKILVDAISGQGAACSVWVELA
jgi:hypothetical protein